MLAVHRVPPQLMGIMPNNIGEFVDVEKASQVFVRNDSCHCRDALRK